MDAGWNDLLIEAAKIWDIEGVGRVLNIAKETQKVNAYRNSFKTNNGYTKTDAVDEPVEYDQT